MRIKLNFRLTFACQRKRKLVENDVNTVFNQCVRFLSSLAKIAPNVRSIREYMGIYGTIRQCFTICENAYLIYLCTKIKHLRSIFASLLQSFNWKTIINYIGNTVLFIRTSLLGLLLSRLKICFFLLLAPQGKRFESKGGFKMASRDISHHVDDVSEITCILKCERLESCKRSIFTMTNAQQQTGRCSFVVRKDGNDLDVPEYLTNYAQINP